MIEINKTHGIDYSEDEERLETVERKIEYQERCLERLTKLLDKTIEEVNKIEKTK